MAAVSAIKDNPWEFSVRLDSQEPGNYETPAYLDSSPKDSTNIRTLGSNGVNTKPLAVQEPNSTNGQQLNASRNGRLSRKTSDLGESDGSSDPPRPVARTRSNTANDSRKMRKPSAPKSAATKAEEEQYWIHRDKLAQIEQRELEVMGFRMSAAGAALSSEAVAVDEDYGLEFPNYSNGVTATDAETSHHSELASAPDLVEDYSSNAEWDFRTPEEIAGDSFIPYVSPPPRYNGSKLPIKKPGKVFALPTDDRDILPLKSRNVSGQPTGIPEPRARSRSAASRGTSGTGTRPHTPAQGTSSATPSASDKSDSPPPAPLKIAGKTVATPRKTSTARVVSTAKSRTASTVTKGDSPPKRPNTSSGLGGRPSTSQRPEGEAPWIATMYKPDPRLPPDQQVLPTHARRIAQEQWEKEGKIGTVYDKDFRLLNTTTLTNPHAAENSGPNPLTEQALQSSPQTSPTKDYLNLDFNHNNSSPTYLSRVQSHKSNSHPELPLGSPRPQSSGNRPGTSGTDHGGYKTIPTIHGPPTPRSSVQPKPAEPIRLRDFDDDAGMKDKGCCCVVM